MIKDILKFDWLLDIKADSLWITLLVMPPIYILWIFKIGRLGEKLTASKNNWLFYFISLLFFGLSVAFILDLLSKEILFLHYLYVLNIDYRLILLLFAILVASWLYFIYYATIMTLRMEEFENEDYVPKRQDKIYRYFLIKFGILGFWIVQPKLNELNKKIKSSL